MNDQSAEGAVNEEALADTIEQASGTELVIPGRSLPATIHLLPVTGRPFFPAQVMPVIINSEPWLETIQAIGEMDHHVTGLALVDPADPEQAGPEDFREMGSLVRVHHPGRVDGKIQFIAEGMRRFVVRKWIRRSPPFLVQVDYPEPPEEDADELRAYALAIINTIKELIPLNPLYSEELKSFLNRFSPNEPSSLTDFAASITSSPAEELQEVLETVAIKRRMEKVLVLLKKEVEVAKIQTRIRQRVEEKVSDQQRQFFLREQLKQIQKELGIAKDDRTADIDRFKQRMEGLDLPEGAQKRIDEELNKLAVLETGSPEYGVTRNYVDTLTDLPWGVYSDDLLDLERARDVLDRDHDGLDDVKDRIIEFLAVGVFRGSITGSILLLVGPPGVGKTSIGRSVAEALGRKFYRFSVGGMRDEAEIKGHRRTYIGAMPGKLIQALRDTEVANPVIMLDELDKVGASYRGDPASALLEVLDPEQNREFLDHYLDVRFDLSKVMFICTANQLDTIPAPLLDRMEIIRLAGYIAEEKLEIARHHLIPRQYERAGLKSKQLKISDGALKRIIEGYAREAGVRNLEKLLGKLVRKAIVQLLGGAKEPVRIGVPQVEEYLGPPPFRPERSLSGVGVVTGLAWTPLGGATLAVEANKVHDKSRGIRLTGKLGEVMRESAEIAYSYLSANLRKLDAPEGYFDHAFVHVHVPEGATPKDGPSAGITMATALLSLARRRRVRRNIAMTGELTLTGQVLPVGGIREKVIAARRNRIFELILPETNRRDFDELPDYIRDGMKAHFVSTFPEVKDLVFD